MMTCISLKRSLSSFLSSCRCNSFGNTQVSSFHKVRKQILQGIHLTDTKSRYRCLPSCLHNHRELGQTGNHCMWNTPLIPTIACISLSGRSHNLIRHPHRRGEDILEFQESNRNHLRYLESHTDSIFLFRNNHKDLAADCNPASSAPQHEAVQNIDPEDKKYNCLSSYPHTRCESGQTDSFDTSSTRLIPSRSCISL